LIEVNLPQRMLFHFEGGRLSGAYPVAIGQPGKQWQTPTGAFTVIQMREDPTGECQRRYSVKRKQRARTWLTRSNPDPTIR